MPNKEMNKLEVGSEDPQTKAAISSCIAEEIRNGTDPEQAQAMCIQMAKDKTTKKAGLEPTGQMGMF